MGLARADHNCSSLFAVLFFSFASFARLLSNFLANFLLSLCMMLLRQISSMMASQLTNSVQGMGRIWTSLSSPSRCLKHPIVLLMAYTPDLPSAESPAYCPH